MAFDQRFITVAADGEVAVSGVLGTEARAILGLDVPRRVRWLEDQYQGYLEEHQKRLRRGYATGSPPTQKSFA